MSAASRVNANSSYIRHPRQVPVSKSMNNVRFSWFVIGSVFGLTASVLLDMGTAQVMRVAVMEPAPAAKEAPAVQTAALPEAETPATFIAPAVEATETPEEPTLPDESLNLAENLSLPTESWWNRLFGGESSAPEETAETTVTAEALPEDPAMSAATLKELAVAVREAGAPHFPRVLSLEVGKGDTMLNMLTDAGVGYEEAMKAVEAMKPEYNPRRLRQGQEMEVVLTPVNDSEKRSIDSVSITLSRIDSVQLSRDEQGGFNVAKVQKELTPELTFAGGTITNSLFETGYANGVPNGVLAELVKAYSYDVDFQREIQRGDQMEVLFEKMTTEDGDTAGYGKIFYAELKLRGEPLSIYRFEDKEGYASFFNEKGESIVKALLKTPIDGARISSNYGMRKHPILGYSKLHSGTDFAARTGTPIYASGDGKIVFKGRKGGYGNYIKIQHNDTYASAYAHMNGFARGMANGKRVKQGDIIGYVGTTGRSTGPHLHYEVHKNGRQVNPLGEKFKAGKELKGTELANFQREVSRIKQQVASMPKSSTQMASAE
jgi:murein DD-endopeptidase MepM/ murein hydrolase activator NlpD